MVLELRLLTSRPEWRVSASVRDLPEGAQRLLALLALKGASLDRQSVSEQLWPDLPSDRASSRLRKLLWRLKDDQQPLLHVTARRIAIHSAVLVDYRAGQEILDSLLSPSADSRDVVDRPTSYWSFLHEDLLAGLDEDWLRQSQDHWRQRRARALDLVAGAYLDAGAIQAALDVSDSAAALDPLREAPRRVAIAACLTLGEKAEALARFREYVHILRAELDIAPSSRLCELLNRR